MSCEFNVTLTTTTPPINKLDDLQNQIDEFRELTAEEIAELEEILS